MAPNLHWPDTMFSYDHGTGIMYTCDAFGGGPRAAASAAPTPTTPTRPPWGAGWACCPGPLRMQLCRRCRGAGGLTRRGCRAAGLHYCSEDPYDSDVKAVLPHYRWADRGWAGVAAVAAGLCGWAGRAGGWPWLADEAANGHRRSLRHVARPDLLRSAEAMLPPISPLPHLARRFYYDCLMRPNAKSVTTALRKVKDLPFTMVANGHGPILKWVAQAGCSAAPGPALGAGVAPGGGGGRPARGCGAMAWGQGKPGLARKAAPPPNWRRAAAGGHPAPALATSAPMHQPSAWPTRCWPFPPTHPPLRPQVQRRHAGGRLQDLERGGGQGARLCGRAVLQRLWLLGPPEPEPGARRDQGGGGRGDGGRAQRGPAGTQHWQAAPPTGTAGSPAAAAPPAGALLVATAPHPAPTPTPTPHIIIPIVAGT
jgi:hypothetical protein